jgi:hypothetical protein
MKQVTLQRAWSSGKATLGMLSIQGVEHDPIFTLENPLRSTPVDSRIPAGFYQCKPYSGSKFQNVYLVQGVFGREAILIHWGNFEKDTSGCILVGLESGVLQGEPAVMFSKKAFDYFHGLIGEDIFELTVKELIHD